MYGGMLLTHLRAIITNYKEFPLLLRKFIQDKKEDRASRVIDKNYHMIYVPCRIPSTLHLPSFRRDRKTAISSLNIQSRPRSYLIFTIYSTQK